MSKSLLSTFPALRLTRPALSLIALASLTPLLPLAAAQSVKGQSIVVNPVGGAAVTGLTLINADTNQPVPGFDPIQPGATLDLTKLPGKLNIRANTSGAVKSVWFGLDGNGNYRLEGGAPYSLCSDRGGDYDACPAPVFAPGPHNLLATPFAGTEGSGAAGQAASLNFTVVRSAAQAPAPTPTPAPAAAVTSFTLINADTNQPVPGFDPIPAGARLRLSALPPRLNVRANTSGNVRSVRFVRDGQTYVENEAPYSMCGDTKDKSGKKGDFLPCPADRFSPGNHRLSATPFTQMFAKGSTGQALTWDYSVDR
ncbi:hypothetical protein [Deinococcus koreensis]|uniref:hypothetical protein n=1 Tax=Deinococcus koreensis TaxID=2054903 RepID=UPI0013FD356C|nr:hypothetical protein [Deinococcus koreensis]